MSQLNPPHLRNLSGWVGRALAFRREGPGFKSLSCQCRKWDGVRLTHQWLIRCLTTAWVFCMWVIQYLYNNIFKRKIKIKVRIYSESRLGCRDGWVIFERRRSGAMSWKVITLHWSRKKGVVYLGDIPCGVLKFSVNAGLKTLPSFDNLKRWGKRVNDRYPFCGNIQTLAHILSNCQVAS